MKTVAILCFAIAFGPLVALVGVWLGARIATPQRKQGAIESKTAPRVEIADDSQKRA